MLLERLVKARADSDRKRIGRLEDELKTFPEGELHCYKHKNGYIMRVTQPDRSRVYIPKGRREDAAILARKALCEAELRDLRAEAEACRRFLKAAERYPYAVERLAGNEGMCDLLKDISWRGSGFDARRWMEASYEKLTAYPEGLRIPTLLGFRVRSKSEALLVQLLVDLKIPFRYEQRCVVAGRDFYPDFTILRPRDQKEMIIELFGMMDHRDYARSAADKLSLYLEGGWVPDQNLFCFYETSGVPMDVVQVDWVLRHFVLEEI